MCFVRLVTNRKAGGLSFILTYISLTMTKRDEFVSNANNSTITDTLAHETGIQLTDDAISTLTYLQEDGNGAIDTWTDAIFRMAKSIVSHAPGMDVDEKYYCIEQLFSVVDIFDSFKAPKVGEDE